MKLNELRQIIREEAKKALNEGISEKEAKRREVYRLTGNYLYANFPKYKSFSWDKDTDNIHFYKGDWSSTEDEKPIKTMSLKDLQKYNFQDILAKNTWPNNPPTQT